MPKKATFSTWLLSTSPRTFTPVTCSQPDPVVVWREWGTSGKSACSGAPPRLAAALRGLGLVPPEKALAIAPLCWRHVGQTHPHQQPAWGHFTTFFLLLLTQTSKHTGPAAVTTALYGPVCLYLRNGHSCVYAHVLETGLGCSDDMLNTASSQRRRTTCVCYTQRQKIRVLKRNGWPAGTSYSAKDRQPSRVTF